VTILTARTAGRDVSGLLTWESESCLDLTPLVSSSVKREEVMNRKILSSLQILCSSEVPVTDTMWDFVREMVVL